MQGLALKHKDPNSAIQELVDNARAVGTSWNADDMRIDIKVRPCPPTPLPHAYTAAGGHPLCHALGLCGERSRGAAHVRR